MQGLLPALDRFAEAASVAEKWRVLGPLERRLQRSIAKAFRSQGQKFVKQFAMLRPRFAEARAPQHRGTHALRETLTADDWLQIWDIVTGQTTETFFEVIQDAVRQALLAGARSAIADIGLDIAFTLANPRAVAYLDQHGYGLISQIDAVTRGNLATIISNGVREGWSYDRTAREIIALYSEMAVGKPQQHIESRAHLIAITEAGNAYEEGSSIVVRELQEAGLQMEKSWLTVGDNRVSAGCHANQEAGWIPFNQTFPSGHLRPLRFPGCRCTALHRRRPH